MVTTRIVAAGPQQQQCGCSAPGSLKPFSAHPYFKGFWAFWHTPFMFQHPLLGQFRSRCSWLLTANEGTRSEKLLLAWRLHHKYRLELGPGTIYIWPQALWCNLWTSFLLLWAIRAKKWLSKSLMKARQELATEQVWGRWKMSWRDVRLNTYSCFGPDC